MFGLRMLAVKKSMNLSAARSSAAATIAGTSIAPATGSRMATSFFTIVDLIRRLRTLRNDAAHATDFELSTSSAIEYFYLAAQVVGYLEGVAASRQPDESTKASPARRSAAE